jgi:hypothetical protein
MKKFHWFAYLLITIALGTFLTELIRYFGWDHKPEWWVFAIAAFPGFFGFYLLDPKRAKDAFGFATDQTVKIITVFRPARITDGAGAQVAVTTVTPPTGVTTQVVAPPGTVVTPPEHGEAP